MGRGIITQKDVDPKHQTINDFLNGDFQAILGQEGLKYAYASAREIKTGRLYDDRIYAPRVGFWKNFFMGPELVADMARSIEGTLALDIRVLNPDYGAALRNVTEQAKQYDVVKVSLK